MWDNLRGADYSLLILAIPAYFIGVWLRAIRWQHLLSPVKALPAGHLFPYTVLGFMSNNVLPLRVGELVRAYLLGEKESISKSAVLATILIERVLDALTLLFFAVVISFFVPLPDWLRTVVTMAGVVFLGILALSLAASLLPKATLTVTDVLTRPLPGSIRPKVRNLVQPFLEGLASLRQGRVLGRISLLSLAVWLVECSVFILVGYGFHMTVGPHAYLLAMSAANLGISVPSSSGGIGPFEFLAASTMVSLFGQDPSRATAYALVVHVTLLLPVTLLGFFYLWREHLSLKTLSGGQKTEVGEVASQR